VKLHLNNTKENEIDIEREWKTLQDILKSAAYESLGTTKRRIRRKYLKIWDDQIRQLIETKKKSYRKWLNSKKLEDKLEYKRNTALAKREVRKRQRLSWDKFVTNLEYDTYRTQPKVYKILKQISKDVKETARIQENIDENTFFQYYGKLWNTTNINELQLEYNSADYLHASITLDELEKALKLTKNRKTPEQDNINSELYKYAPEEFKLRLLQFLNNIYRENCFPDEWRNAVITPIYKKGDRTEPKNYREISILNTCYKIYSKILNMKLQDFSEAFMKEPQNGFRKGRSCTDSTFCLKLLIEKKEGNLIWKHICCL